MCHDLRGESIIKGVLIRLHYLQMNSQTISVSLLLLSVIKCTFKTPDSVNGIFAMRTTAAEVQR